MDVYINNREKILLEGLRQDNDNDILSIAKNNNIPKSTMFNLYKKLEKNKILKKSVLVDFDKIGYPIKLFFLLKVSIKEKTKLRIYLRNNINVNSLYMLGSEFDFLIEGIFENFREAYEFELELSENFTILNKSVLNVIEDISKEAFLRKC